MDTVPLTAPELASLSVGSLVIAVYPEDGRRYRAKLEEVVEKGEEKVFRVRYIDYGNVSQVGISDLFQWNPVLQVIPPQAFCCRLRESKIMFKEPVVMRTPDAAKFLLFMKVWSPFQMVVSKVRRPREKIFSSKKCQEPEIVVDLVARDGILVSTKLRCSSLKHLLRKVDVSSLNSTSSPSVNITSDSGLISSSSALGPPSESLKPLEKVRLWMQLDQIGIKNQMKVLNNDISQKLQKNAYEEDEIDKLVGFQEETLEEVEDVSFSEEQKRILGSLKKRSHFQAKMKAVSPHTTDRPTVTMSTTIANNTNTNISEDEKKPTNIYKSKYKPLMSIPKPKVLSQIRARSSKPKPVSSSVCVFFLRGCCSFGPDCWFRHEKPNPLDNLVIPERGTTVVVWCCHIDQAIPSHFYIMFPYGAKSISDLTEKQRKAHPRKVPEKRKLIDDMNYYYKNESKCHLDLMPARGSLVAVKERKCWVRAKVTSDINKHGKVEVFLVDDGRTYKVNHGDLRKLDSKFTILPFQIKEACIDGFGPVGSSCMREEARKRMLKICKAGDYLTAKIVANVRDKLVIELRVHKGGKSMDVGQALFRRQLAVKREVVRRGK